MVALCERKVMQHFWSVSWMREGEDGIVGSSKSKVETIKLRVYCTLCRKMFTRVYRTASWLLPTEGRGPDGGLYCSSFCRGPASRDQHVASRFKFFQGELSLHFFTRTSGLFSPVVNAPQAHRSVAGRCPSAIV